jgi:hypothetical protein
MPRRGYTSGMKNEELKMKNEKYESNQVFSDKDDL